MIQSLIYQLALLQSHSCTYSHANQARPLKSTPDYSSSWNFYLEFTASLISKLLTTKASWETCFHYKLCGEFKIESWILLRILSQTFDLKSWGLCYFVRSEVHVVLPEAFSPFKRGSVMLPWCQRPRSPYHNHLSQY